MKKEFKKRLAEIERKSLKLCAAEQFKIWLAEHYPEQCLSYADYMQMMSNVPDGLKEECLDQLFKAIEELKCCK